MQSGHTHVKVSSSMFVGKHEGRFNDTYRVTKQLGEGAFGKVSECIHRESRQKFAVKVLQKMHMDSVQQDKLINEMRILRELDHPNIVKIMEYFEDEEKFYIVTELCSGGEVFDEIVKQGSFSEKDAQILTKQILSAVSYCHSHNIVHRDLKPDNILFEQTKEFDQIKIIDFGCSRHYNQGQLLMKEYGTPYYQAPELLKHNYSKECDVWSIGVILFIFLCGLPPFNAVSNAEIRQKILTGKFRFEQPIWKKVSSEAKDLIQKMLTYEPEHRITADEALQHPWIAQSSQLPTDETFEKEVIVKLRSFHSHEALKASTFNYIASQLISKKDREELARVFKKLDLNCDGRLSKAEIKNACFKYYKFLMGEDEIEKIFDAVDTDQSGYIEYTEFVVACEKSEEILQEERLNAAFKMFDKDGSGGITKEEIKMVLSEHDKFELPEEILNKIMAKVDANNDGVISADEFKTYMRQSTL